MNQPQFYLPSARQISYRKFDVDEFEKRVSAGGFNAMKVLYWNYSTKRFQWHVGATCLVAFDEREFFLRSTGLVDESSIFEVAEELPFFCESVRESSAMPDVKRRLAESVATFFNGCGVRFDAEDLVDKLGRDDLIDADALDKLDKIDEPCRFGGAFGYKFQRAKYEKIIERVTGRRFIVRGDFNDVCFDEGKVRAAAETLRDHLDEVDKYAEFWLLNDSQRGKAIIAGHASRLFGYSGTMLATF